MAIRDPILASHLNEFKERHIGISRNDETAFEHFVNYFVLSNEMRGGSLAVEQVRREVHTGGSGYRGIDGIALLVNGRIASTEDDVDGYAGYGRGTTDAAIHFIQTTTQDGYDESKVLNFLADVEAFLSHDDPNGQDFNALVRERQKAYRHLLREKGATLRAGQPTVKLFYVYPGNWPTPFDVHEWWQMPGSRLGANVTNPLRRMNRTFGATENPIRFEIIDARRLRGIHDNVTRQRVVASNVSFPNRLPLPDLSGARASYIGVINCKEYVDKIVRDPITGELNQNLAIGNVRLFLGSGDGEEDKDDGKVVNKVNKQIVDTIKDNAAKKEFMLLNNGITIVAEDAYVPANPTMPCDIFNYQIVNGWQTTNVLYDMYEYLDDHTYVPVRLVVTEDHNLTDRIVRATHSQTPVGESQFLALNPRQLQLEDTYSHPPTGFDLRKINYRRQVSADHLPLDGPTIDIVAQMECYVSMFMGQPHQVNTVRYRELLRGEDNLTPYYTVFNDDHPDDFFYVAGYTLCEAEDFIRDLYEEQDSPSDPGISFDEMMNYKHHLLFLFRIMHTEGAPPKSNSARGVQSYRDALLTVLSDKTEKDKAFHDAVSVLKEGLDWFGGQDHEGEARRWAGFTTKLTEIAKSGTTAANAPRRGSQAANRRARSETTPQASSAPAANNAAAGDAPQRAPAATPPSQPKVEPRQQPSEATTSSQPKARRRTSSDDNVLTGTIVDFVMLPNRRNMRKKRANWCVRISTSDGEIKEYLILARNVKKFQKQLTIDNAVGKAIRFVEATGSGSGSAGDILYAEILEVL